MCCMEWECCQERLLVCPEVADAVFSVWLHELGFCAERRSSPRRRGGAGRAECRFWHCQGLCVSDWPSAALILSLLWAAGLGTCSRISPSFCLSARGLQMPGFGHHLSDTRAITAHKHSQKRQNLKGFAAALLWLFPHTLGLHLVFVICFNNLRERP